MVNKASRVSLVLLGLHMHGYSAQNSTASNVNPGEWRSTISTATPTTQQQQVAHSPKSGHLRYFGWYSLTAADDMVANAGKFNLAFELHEPQAVVVAHHLGATVLVSVKHLFFNTKVHPITLKPGYNESWTAASQRWRPFVANSTVVGFW